MSNLNYRRGFQRAWVVASVLWAVAVIAVSILEPSADDALAKKWSLVVDPSQVQPAFTPPPLESEGQPATPVKLPPDAVDVPNPNPTLSDADIAKYDRRNAGSKPRRDIFDQIADENHRKDLLKYWGLRSTIAVVPPVIGYLILFSILPWVGRGFAKDQVSKL